MSSGEYIFIFENVRRHFLFLVNLLLLCIPDLKIFEHLAILKASFCRATKPANEFWSA